MNLALAALWIKDQNNFHLSPPTRNPQTINKEASPQRAILLQLVISPVNWFFPLSFLPIKNRTVAWFFMTTIQDVSTQSSMPSSQHTVRHPTSNNHLHSRLCPQPLFLPRTKSKRGHEFFSTLLHRCLSLILCSLTFPKNLRSHKKLTPTDSMNFKNLKLIV